MSEPDTRSFTSKKLDLQRRAGADRRMTDGQFRHFCRVLQATNERTGVAVIGDETIIDEVPSCSSQSTCKKNRKAIAGLGYWTVRPGKGKVTTEYEIHFDACAQIDHGLDRLREERRARRRAHHQAWRERKADGAVRDGLPGDADGAVHTPLHHADGATGDGADGAVRDGQTGPQDPLYTFMTPSTIQEATEESSLVSARGADVAPVLPSPSPSPAPPARSVPALVDDEDDEAKQLIRVRGLVIRELGDGDRDRGRELVAFLDEARLSEIIAIYRSHGARDAFQPIADARQSAQRQMKQSRQKEVA